jgi:hypothetical protein
METVIPTSTTRGVRIRRWTTLPPMMHTAVRPDLLYCRTGTPRRHETPRIYTLNLPPPCPVDGSHLYESKEHHVKS